MPQTSIVMPVYNGEKYLGQTIEGVRAQTVSDWELVVVDDGSTDGSVTVAQRYAAHDRRIRVVQQSNAGVAAARNRGLRELDPASAYVIFLDQDDLWESDALETMTAALERKPADIAAHGLMQRIDEHNHPLPPGSAEHVARRRKGVVGTRLVPWPRENPTTFAVLVFENILATPGQVLIRRSAITSVGPFDAAMAPADDWDMWLRLSHLGDIVYVDKVVIGWRQHATNASHQRPTMHQARMRVFRKLLSSYTGADEQRLILQGYRWNRRFQGHLYLLWARENVARGNLWQAAKQLRHVLVEWLHFHFGATRLLPPK